MVLRSRAGLCLSEWLLNLYPPGMSSNGSTAAKDEAGGASPVTDVLVIFGITGDLAKKMTFRALYRLEKRNKLNCPIIGVGRRTDWGHETMRQRARESIEHSLGTIDETVFKRLADRMRFVAGNFDDPGTFSDLADQLGERRHPLFYLEVPPPLFASIIEQLRDAGLTDRARFIIEKPFGHDLASAKELQAELTQVLDEDQILRIDHYLGKEPVMDITYLRFANSTLEPVWNREHIDYVQMTMAESFGVEDRGRFYEGVGAIRDVIQNHMLQVLALVAMESPNSNQHDSIRAQKYELFQAIRAIDPDRCVRGQYVGYRDIPEVADDSQVETFAAVELAIDNWRWSGVPFYLRTGKNLPVKQTELRVAFKRPPRIGVGSGAEPDRNSILVRIDPDPGARMRYITKAAGVDSFQNSDFEVLFEKEPGTEPEPYERLLDDAINGRTDLFTRIDSIEETWRIVQPLLDDPPEVVPYEKGSWGPAEADRLVKGVCRWDEPWRPVEPEEEHRLLGL